MRILTVKTKPVRDKVLSMKGEYTTRDIANHFGVTTDDVKSIIYEMKRAGLIVIVRKVGALGGNRGIMAIFRTVDEKERKKLTNKEDAFNSFLFNSALWCL